MVAAVPESVKPAQAAPLRGFGLDGLGAVGSISQKP